MRVIAIDGPAGSGKSTIARHVAEALGLRYLDTGAMYRSVAFAALRRGIDPTDAEPVAHVAREVELRLDAAPSVRAERRSNEVKDLSYETVADDLARRDAYDSARAHSPLRTADDAVVIDTSDRSVDEIVAAVLDRWEHTGV